MPVLHAGNYYSAVAQITARQNEDVEKQVSVVLLSAHVEVNAVLRTLRAIKTLCII
jgi:hypothetical protein